MSDQPKPKYLLWICYPILVGENKVYSGEYGNEYLLFSDLKEAKTKSFDLHRIYDAGIWEMVYYKIYELPGTGFLEKLPVNDEIYAHMFAYQ